MIADIALSITAAGVIAAVLGLRQSYRERLRQFEAMYVQRYWSIIDRLSLEALGSPSVAQTADSDEHAIRAYLLLCEDELEMRERGYIADTTYTIWASGICEQLDQPVFAQVWAKVSSEPTFRYEYLKMLCKSEGAYDPLRPGKVRHWLRGLAGPAGV